MVVIAGARPTPLVSMAAQGASAIDQWPASAASGGEPGHLPREFGQFGFTEVRISWNVLRV